MRNQKNFSIIQKALIEMRLKDLKIKKSIPFSYVLVEYKAGWLDKRQIEFLLEDFSSLLFLLKDFKKQFYNMVDDTKQTSL
jgi:hypothetical protein